MSLYLQAAVGAGRYLLEAAHIVDVRPVVDLADAARWRGEELPCVDLRTLFGEEVATQGYCVLFAQAAGGTAGLFVDAVDRLVEIGRGDWRPLPPIGPLGQLIDAVTTKLALERPMLRLRGERALAAVSGLDIAAGADRG